MPMMVVAGACFVASGVVTYNAELQKYVGAGTGDLINTMVTAGIAVGMLMLIKDKFGSTAVVAMPIVVGVGSAFIGLLLLPYVKMITTAIGTVINEFTTLQPILMSILICCSFAILIHLSNFYSSDWFSDSIKRRVCRGGCYGGCRNSCSISSSFMESQ